jgi:hypothetical protein
LASVWETLYVQFWGVHEAYTVPLLESCVFNPD